MSEDYKKSHINDVSKMNKQSKARDKEGIIKDIRCSNVMQNTLMPVAGSSRPSIETTLSLPGPRASTSQDFQFEEDDKKRTNRQKSSVFGGENKYPASGLKQTLHGNIYQLKLLMLFANRGLKEGYDFALATEMDAAGKFDDVVFRYADKAGAGTVGRYLQAKHSLNESRTISTGDLLNKKDGDFSLQKYFMSYRKIKKHPELMRSKFQDCILCTNINFDSTKRKHERSKFHVHRDKNVRLRPEDLDASEIGLEEIDGFDAILDVKNSEKQSARYRLVINDRHELHETLRESSDTYLLAKELAKHVFNKTKITSRTEIFKFYRIALVDHVIDINEKCIRPTFANNVGKLSSEVRKFRKIFGIEFSKLMKLPQGNDCEETIKVKLQEVKLQLSENFGNKFKPKKFCITEIKKFSTAFVSLIRETNNDNLIVIDRKSFNRNAEKESDARIIGTHIDKLAGSVLIVENKKIKFHTKFFTESMHSELSDDLVAFKNELKILLNGEEYEDLENYRFEVKNSPQHWDLLYATNKLPDDDVEIDEIHEFLNQLTFAVGQPNEVELGKIIQNEIGEDSRFNVLSADLVSNCFEVKMLDWFKQKGKRKGEEGILFTSEKGRAFFKSMEEKVDNLICFGLGVSYPEELEGYGVEFEDENQELKDFLNNESRRVLNLIAGRETLPTAIRVHKTIRKQEKYKKDHSLIFMRLRSLRPDKTKKLVIRSFDSTNRFDLLVIDCESPNNEDSQTLQNMYLQLEKVMKKENSAKKLIFITQGNNHSSAMKIDTILQNCEKKSDQVVFKNLTRVSREKLLNKRIVNLQEQREKPISFLKLLGFRNVSEIASDFEDAIDSSILVKLICGEEIILGTAVKAFGRTEVFYISRSFYHLVHLREEILKTQQESDVFAISGIDTNDLRKLVTNPTQIRSFSEIDRVTPESCKFIILDNEQTTEQFHNVCSKYSSDKYNVHWLMRESSELFWKESRGDITNLLEYRDEYDDDHKTNKTTVRYLHEDELADNNDKVKVIIISGSSGIGKSTILTSLARQLKGSNTWVIRIDLNECTQVLKQQKKEVEDLNSIDEHSDDWAVDFFVEKLVKLGTVFEQKVLKTMLKCSDRVVLLVDAFDEISPDYKKIVITVLRRIRNATGVKKLFVSTRPHMTKELETGLKTFSYTMVPFSKKNMIDFLIRFWKNNKRNTNCTEQRSKECLQTYAERLIREIGSSIDDPVNEFFSIPLHAWMIAELYQDLDAFDKGVSHSEEPRKIEIVDLYKEFVKKKFAIRYEDKSKADLSHPDMKENIAEVRERSLVMHQKFALKALFSTPDLKILLTAQQRKNLKIWINKMCKGKEKTGIITDKAKFIHRSFAEYFAAIFLTNKLKGDDLEPKLRRFIVETILLQREYSIIRSFINGLLLKSDSSPDSELDSEYDTEATIDCSWKSLLDEIRNTFGETIFHIAVQERNGEIIKFFLARFGDKNLTSQFLDEAKDRTDETALYIAASGQRWDELKLLVDHGEASVNCRNSSGRTPLHEAVSSGNFSMVKWLVENGANIDAMSTEDQTPLHWAMLSEKLDILEYLMKEKKVNAKSLLSNTIIHDCPSSVREWLKNQPSTSRDRSPAATQEKPKRKCKRKLKRNVQGQNDEICHQETAVSKRKVDNFAPGLKQALRENIYQTRLVMFLLMRAAKEDCNFRLGVEVEATGKASPLVLQYEKQAGSGIVCRFLEVKYKQGESKKISAIDLLNGRNSGFSLKEHFISYRRMEKHPELSKCEKKDYVVWTNSDFDFKKLERAGIKVQPVEEPETLLDIESTFKISARYKFCIDEKSQLYDELKNSSDVYALAKTLAERIVHKKSITLKTHIFDLYHTALATEVIDVWNKRFFTNFIEGKNLSHMVMKFRELFAEVFLELMEQRGECVTKENMWTNIKDGTLKLPQTFGKHKEIFKASLTEQKKISKEFTDLLKSASDGDLRLVKLDRVGNVIADNIEKLIGHVLVATEHKNIYKFGSLLLDDTIQQPPEIKRLKKSLKAFVDLFRFQFEIQNANLYSTSAFPDDTVMNGEISAFLDNLIFAVNQPNDDELGNIMMKEIDDGNDLHLLDADLISSSFVEEFFNRLKKNSEEKGGAITFLTTVDGEAIIHPIEKRANTLVNSLMGSLYPKKLTDYGIEFKDTNDKFTKFIRDYFDRSTNIPALRVIAASKTLPTAIKVQRIIQNTLPKYAEPNSLIFMHHRTLLAPKIKERVIRAYGSRRHDVLIIECGSGNKDHLKELCNKLYEIMALYSRKKLILITTNSEVQSKIDFQDYEEEHDEISFNNLTQSSQQKLMDKRCITFQDDDGTSFGKLLGKRVCDEIVSNRAEFRSLIDSSSLVKLIRGDNITVGNILEDLSEITDFYVKRKINRQIVLKKYVLESEEESDVFAVSGINEETLRKLNVNQSKIGFFDKIDWQTQPSYRYIILDNDRDAEQYERVRAGYKSGNHNVHWLKKVAENFIWKKSQGSVSNLVEYADVGTNLSKNSNFDQESSTLMDDQLAEHDKDCKVVIISGAPGMGKTTLLTHVGAELKQQESVNQQDLWVIGIDFYEFTEVLEKESKHRSFSAGDIGGAVDFFVEKFSKLSTDLEKMILKIMMKNDGEVALLFDGFDKIRPHHEGTVIDLLQVIQKLAGVKKLFISTRLHMRKALEAKLGIFSHTMMPFNEVNQIFFFNRFWRQLNSGCSVNEIWQLESRAKKLIKQLYANSVDVKMNDFIGIPLQMRIIAEVHKYKSESFEELSRLQKKMKMADLYRWFIEWKNHRYCEREGIDESKQFDELFSKPHLALLLYTLFDAHDLVTLDHEQEMETMNKNVYEVYQIITQIIDDRPKFIHHTFAEYLTAMFLTNVLDEGDHNPEILKFITEHILLRPNCYIIRAFLNGLLFEKSPSDVNNASWKSMWENSRNEFGATIFEVAAKEGHVEIDRFFRNLFGEYQETEKFQESTRRKKLRVK